MLVRQVVVLVWVDHVTVEIRLPDVVRVVYVDVMVQGITARDRGGGDGDWKLGVVWSGEHCLVNVLRVL